MNQPPKSPQNQPAKTPPPNQPPPQGKNDGKGAGYSNYGTYGDYGNYGSSGGYGGGGYGGYGGQGGYGPGGGYSGYYYGYGYGYGNGPGGNGEPTQSRNIRDYLVILRERIWYLLLTFFVIFGAFVLYLVNATPEFIATASLRVFKSEESAMPTMHDAASDVVGPEDFNTRIRLMETRDIAANVAARMSDDDKKAFLLPFKSNNPLQPELNIVDRLIRSRTVAPGRLAYIMQIGVEHPNPQLAAVVADDFAEEFINYNSKLNVEKAMKAVEQLDEQSKEQKAKLTNLQAEMQSLVDLYGLPNLDPHSNILPSTLLQLNEIAIKNQDDLDIAATRVNQVEEYRAAGKPLWTLGFIASDSHVSKLLTDIGDDNVKLDGLSQHFGELHPQIVELKKELQQTQAELQNAVNDVAKTVNADYSAARAKVASANLKVDDLHKQIMDLSKVQEHYDQLATEKDTAELMYRQMLQTVENQRQKVILGGESYQIVDHANGQVSQSEPKTVLLICAGLITGLMSGIGMAFLVAFLDDRIKSAFDIESYVGLPLIGILPRIAHLNANEKAQAVASNADRRITEAFRSIYSALKLNDASKNARVILVTSTVPSEGKSFMTTNLALTYAMHAERVLLVDCDLRMPNVAKSLGREAIDQGLMTHLQEGRPFEECIVKDFYPGLDVMPTGGRTNNPTQIFNSREFTDFVARMRQQYDRVFIDSPPLGAVSDALNLLPCVDGVLYVIKFNTVKRKVAKVNLGRLMQGNVPVFGAILNQISLASASYYYTHYYDKSYHNYYMREGENDAQDVSDASAKAAGEPPADGDKR